MENVVNFHYCKLQGCVPLKFALNYQIRIFAEEEPAQFQVKFGESEIFTPLPQGKKTSLTNFTKPEEDLRYYSVSLFPNWE